MPTPGKMPGTTLEELEGQIDLHPIWIDFGVTRHYSEQDEEYFKDVKNDLDFFCKMFYSSLMLPEWGKMLDKVVDG